MKLRYVAFAAIDLASRFIIAHWRPIKRTKKKEKKNENVATCLDKTIKIT